MALQILIAGYDRLKLKPLADQARQVYAANFSSDIQQAEAKETRKHWWKFW